MEEKLVEKCRQYLCDCGCPEELMQDYLKLAEEGRRQEQIYFMRRLRCKTMDLLHECNRRVDCIDFIIHELEQEKQE